MKGVIESICQVSSAKSIDYIDQAIAVIRNPSGEIDMKHIPGNEIAAGILCSDGAVKVRTDRGNYTIKKGQGCIISFTYKINSIEFSSAFKGYISFTDREFCDSIIETDRYNVANYYKTIRYYSSVSVQKERTIIYLKLLTHAIKAGSSLESIRQLIKTVFTIFADYESPKSIETSTRDIDIADRYMRLLEVCDTSDLNEEYFSTNLKLSKRALARAVKKQTGRTPTEHIKHQKIIKAKRMIASMDVNATMESISEAFGFATPSSFTRFFKENTGLTPSQYRESID